MFSGVYWYSVMFVLLIEDYRAYDILDIGRRPLLITVAGKNIKLLQE